MSWDICRGEEYGVKEREKLTILVRVLKRVLKKIKFGIAVGLKKKVKIIHNKMA